MSEHDPDRFALDAALKAPVDGRQSAAAMEIRRGVGRLLRRHAFAMVPELTLASGRRADILAVGPKGEIWIVEIKSSLADFRADHKWPDYRAHCDRLFFATRAEVPLEVFPETAGLILADGFGAEILREAPEHKLPGATRKAVMLRMAQVAAGRLHDLEDPPVAGLI
ncbi:MAG: MmcB family DNA repair protein [Hyphomicrobiales bacterium]